MATQTPSASARPGWFQTDPRKKSAWRNTFSRGDHWVWFTGAALAVCLLMIVGLVGVVLVNGAGFFWPHKLARADLKSGGQILGIITRTESFRKFSKDAHQEPAMLRRSQFKVGNRELYGADFRWVEEPELSHLQYPPAAVALEQEEYGDFYGFLSAFKENGAVVAQGDKAWPLLLEKHPLARKIAARSDHLRKHEMAQITEVVETAQRRLKEAERHPESGSSRRAFLDETRKNLAEARAEFEKLKARVVALNQEGARFQAVMQTVDGKTKEIPLSDIVRAYRPNAMNLSHRLGHYLAKVWEFVSGEPRESNTEGGILPAIFGTVFMTLLMSIAVVPFGVLAAFYLREYSRQGPFVRVVRIAVNNLAGVPSIVFGVFGLGFFVYFVGGSIDQLFFADRLPTPTFGTGGVLWASLTLALLTVPVVIVATEESIAAVPRGAKEGSLALGASKFQTICRVVLPASLPGILTGLILAVARGAGEVAPLMITGVVKMAPNLPLDGRFPFVHLDRKFMHLGFHIYDVGFQSPNVEAAKPMVFTTALLLLAVVGLLNIVAIYIRDRLRKKYRAGAFA
jgi:phosphate transport system permease protein